MLSEHDFEECTLHKCSYTEYKACYCSDCERTECIHRDAYRRLPKIDGGLGLCPNLALLTKNNGDTAPDESGWYFIRYEYGDEISVEKARFQKAEYADEEDKWFDDTEVEITLAVKAWDDNVAICEKGFSA